jgi:hypothetical protein
VNLTQELTFSDVKHFKMQSVHVKYRIERSLQISKKIKNKNMFTFFAQFLINYLIYFQIFEWMWSSGLGRWT